MYFIRQLWCQCQSFGKILLTRKSDTYTLLEEVFKKSWDKLQEIMLINITQLLIFINFQLYSIFLLPQSTLAVSLIFRKMFIGGLSWQTSPGKK